MMVDIKSVWRMEQKILDEIDRICENYHLRYSLAYGTLIGAIRHEGFIPWDDDIDIMMPRKDYEKLLSVWSSEASADYLIQHYKKDLDYTNNFAKVRMNNTTFLQSEEEREKTYHKGIFVDIFPGDIVPENIVLEKIQYIACAFNLLFSRGYCSGTGGIIGLVERMMLKLPSKKYPYYREIAEKIVRKWNASNGKKMIFANTIGECRRYFPAEMFDKLQKKTFSGREYYVFQEYDKILRISYGDYMQLPPEEERVWKHHPLVIDFEHNYEDLER